MLGQICLGTQKLSWCQRKRGGGQNMRSGATKKYAIKMRYFARLCKNYGMFFWTMNGSWKNWTQRQKIFSSSDPCLIAYILNQTKFKNETGEIWENVFHPRQRKHESFVAMKTFQQLGPQKSNWDPYTSKAIPEVEIKFSRWSNNSAIFFGEKRCYGNNFFVGRETLEKKPTKNEKFVSHGLCIAGFRKNTNVQVFHCPSTLGAD